MLRLCWVLAALCGCLRPESETCDDGRVCPAGTVCTATACATREDIAACANLADSDACASSIGPGICVDGACVGLRCGNGRTDPGEVCDDGNRVSGDGCRVDCSKIEACDDLIIDDGEDCDDGNTNAVDGCNACRVTAWTATPIIGVPLAGTDVAFATPMGLTYDLDGRLYVTDFTRNRLSRIDSNGTVHALAGTGELQSTFIVEEGILAASAPLFFPYDVAVDGLGRVYISEAYRVRRIDLDGRLWTVAGNGLIGDEGDDGPARSASLNQATGIAVDALGRLIIADATNNRIRRVDVDGTIRTIAGTGLSGFNGDGGVTMVNVSNPRDVLVEPDGNILFVEVGSGRRVRRIDTSSPFSLAYSVTTVAQLPTAPFAAHAQLALAADGSVLVADDVLRVVHRVAPSGVVSTLAGTGARGFEGDGGPASSALFMSPAGIAISPSGQVAIADFDAARVRRMASVASSATLDTIAGGPIAAGDGYAALSARLADPRSIAFDPQGRLLIAERGANRVRRVALDGTISTVAGMGVQSLGDGGQARGAVVTQPMAVIVDAAGVIYIAQEYRVRRVDTADVITTIAGTGAPPDSTPCTGGAATSCKIAPLAFAFDGQGRLLFSEATVVWRLDGTTMTRVAGNGTAGYAGDGGQATAAQIRYAGALAVDAMGRIYIADSSSSVVRRVATDGVISTFAGTGVAGYRGADEGVQAASAQLNFPDGVGVDSQGRVVISELLSYRVRRVATDGTIRTLAGGGTTTANDGALASAAGFEQLLAVTIDAMDRVHVLDSEAFGQNFGRVRRIDNTATPAIVSVAGKTDPEELGPQQRSRLANPLALAVDASGGLLFAGGTSGTVQRVANGTIAAVVGRYPQSAPTSNLARYRTLDFGDVGGVASAAGKLYASEVSVPGGSVMFHRVHVVDTTASPWTITTLVGDGPGSANGTVIEARLRNPSGLFVDGNRLLIADTDNHAIRAFDLTTSTLSTLVNTTHAFGFAGDGGAAASARLFSPRAITRCPNGDLFVADTGNHRVRRIANNTITTVIGDGSPSSAGEGSPANTFPVDTPLGLACDDAGNLFVAGGAVVRALAADDAGVVDGTGPVRTIFGTPPRTEFPASSAACLAGLAVVGPNKLVVADACTGIAVELAVTVP